MKKIHMKDGSGQLKLRYLVEDVDRHGNVRLYVRRPGKPKIRLRETPGTREFMEAYWAALNDNVVSTTSAISKKQPLSKSSFQWLCAQYYGSAEFKALTVRTQYVRQLILDRICAKDGDKPYVLMQMRHVRKRRDELAATPESANAVVKALRRLFNFAIEYELAERNPAKDVPYLKSGSEGFHSWTIEEVNEFEECHPVGTKARLALAILLYTGQRRSDVVRLGPQHVKKGWLTLTQAKNRDRKPVTLSLPILPELRAVIDATPIGNLAFLVTQFGKPFTANGFGNWFRKRCNEAGLPHCSAHGLRKAGAAIAAENGATERQLMAIFGWTTMKEAERYTRAARQKVLAASGIKHLSLGQNPNKTVPLLPDQEDGGTNFAAKTLKNNDRG